MIEYKVVNHGKSAVSAYNIGVVVLVDGKEVNWGGTGVDLLDPELSLECESIPRDSIHTEAVANNSMPRAIQPGEIFAGSIQLADNGKLNGAIAEVHASVTGIIWADGRIEGNPEGPGGIADMNRFRDTRLQETAEEEKILAIMNAHPEDDDIQHRINDILAGLQALSGESSEQSQNQEQNKQEIKVYGQGAPLVRSVIVSLEGAAASPCPKEVFEFLSGLFTCQHERRVAMLAQAASVVKSAQ